MTTEEFIRLHADDDVRDLALQKAKYPDVDMNYALDQIAGRQMARHKLPSWAAQESIVFPPHLYMEQCSSESTAMYKARLVRELVGCLPSKSLPVTPFYLVDLTAGFGVDFTMMAKTLKEDIRLDEEKMVCVERQEGLCDLVKHNLSVFGMKRVQVVCGDGIDFLERLPYSCFIFLDPARRNVHGGRTYAISDCTPDVLSIEQKLLEKADFVVLKLSPMLDVHATVEALGTHHVQAVHIVSVANECKELLVVLSNQGRPTEVFCVNDDSSLSFSLHDHQPIEYVEQCSDGLYLYEPNASLMKAKCFGLLCRRYDVKAVGMNSHLFVSSRFIADFPGRKFQITAISSMNKKELKEQLQGILSANITTRNFPLSVQDLRKRLKLRDGGNIYIFATTIGNADHRLLICHQM